MSDFVVYVKLEKYLSQWLTNALGSPVRFPAQSNENAVIRRFVQRLPKDKQPQLASDELTAIVIPDSKAKDPRQFNYFGPRAQEALVEAIEDLFRRSMWAELGELLERSQRINKTIIAWCELHGIDDDYSETVRQKFYRIRKAYTQRGVFLQSLTRKKEDENTQDKPNRTTPNNYAEYSRLHS